MSGLYQKAREYIQTQRNLRLVRPEELNEADELGITGDEREQILAQINDVVAQNRITIDDTTFTVTPKKRGGVMPVLVNVIAVALIAGGLFIVLGLFDRREATLVSLRTATESAEGMLLETLKRESEERLSEKEDEIVSIQNRLAEMNLERERLQADVERQVQEREAEIQAEMRAALDAERARLAQNDLSDEEINARIRELEAEQNAEYQERLEQIRSEAEARLAEQENALDEMVSEYEQSLAEAQQARSRLQDELEARQAELRAEMEQRTSQLESERAEVESQLESLRQAREREELALDQLVSFYSQVKQAIGAGNYEAALATLGELTAYLNKAAIAELPLVQRRRQVELFLAESLGELIRSRQEADSQDTASLVESAQLVSAVSKLIDSAEVSYTVGDMDEAERLYRAAMAKIPAVEIGYERLQEIRNRIAAERDGVIASYIDAGNARYVAGEYEEAAEQYGRALSSLPGSNDRLLSRVLDAGYMMKRGGDLEELRAVKSDLETAAAERDAALVRIRGLEDERAALRQEVDEAERSLEERRASLAESRERTAELESTLETRNEEIAALQDSVRELESTLNERTASVSELEEAVRSRDAQLLELRELTKERGDRVEELERVAADRNAELDALKELAEERDARLAALEGTVQDRDARVSELQTAVEERESRLATLTESRDALEARLTPLQRDAERRQDLAEAIDSFLVRYSNNGADESTSAEAGEGSETLSYASALEMLETKLLMTRIMSSDIVKSEYPDLNDQMNRYLEALVKEQREETRVETLADINKLVGELLTATGDEVTAGADDVLDTTAVDDGGSRESFMTFLAHLRRLIY